MQFPACLNAGVARQRCKKLALAFGILPSAVNPSVVVTAGLGGHPDLLQRFLQIDDDLAPVGKGQGDHSSHPLVVDICVRFIIDLIAAGLYGFQQRFRSVHEFRVGHYNFTMLTTKQILISALALGASVLNLSGCGQTGPLYLPATAQPPKPSVPVPVPARLPPTISE